MLKDRKIPLWVYAILVITFCAFAFVVKSIIKDSGKENLRYEKGEPLESNGLNYSESMNKVDMSENPDGFNPDIFDVCNSSSPYLGINISSYIEKYGVHLIENDTPTDAIYTYPIRRRNDQRYYILNSNEGLKIFFC